MTSLNGYVTEYKKQLDKGNIQIAFRGLMEFMTGLKNFFKKNYPEFSVPGSLYQGYMDMTYFALCPENLKERGLKIAIVLIHEKMKLEIWLSGINKQIQKKYWNMLKSKNINGYNLPIILKGADSIIEYVLSDNPDFNDPESLTRQIENVTLKFIKDIKELTADQQ